MKQYRALRAFAHQNSHVDKGALVALSDKQAEYLRASGYIEPTEKPAAQKKGAGKVKPDPKAADDAGKGATADGGKQ